MSSERHEMRRRSDAGASASVARSMGTAVRREGARGVESARSRGPNFSSRTHARVGMPWSFTGEQGRRLDATYPRASGFSPRRLELDVGDVLELDGERLVLAFRGDLVDAGPGHVRLRSRSSRPRLEWGRRLVPAVVRRSIETPPIEPGRRGANVHGPGRQSARYMLIRPPHDRRARHGQPRARCTPARRRDRGPTRRSRHRSDHDRAPRSSPTCDSPSSPPDSGGAQRPCCRRLRGGATERSVRERSRGPQGDALICPSVQMCATVPRRWSPGPRTSSPRTVPASSLPRPCRSFATSWRTRMAPTAPAPWRAQSAVPGAQAAPMRAARPGRCARAWTRTARPAPSSRGACGAPTTRRRSRANTFRPWERSARRRRRPRSRGAASARGRPCTPRRPCLCRASPRPWSSPARTVGRGRHSHGRAPPWRGRRGRTRDGGSPSPSTPSSAPPQSRAPRSVAPARTSPSRSASPACGPPSSPTGSAPSRLGHRLVAADAFPWER